jgi:hypothetical protein
MEQGGGRVGGFARPPLPGEWYRVNGGGVGRGFVPPGAGPIEAAYE